jgi:para-nitrobenzyl esterase
MKRFKTFGITLSIAFVISATGCADDPEFSGSAAEPDPQPEAQPDPQPEGVTELVATAQGDVEGVLTEELEVLSWKGIPFAAAPSGDLRWRPPQAPEVRGETLDASEPGNICYQPATNDFGGLSEDEDCLNLNIWTPAGTAPQSLPVLIWIHGGSFTSGTGSFGIYDGSRLAQRGAVVVGINYRLGPLGFMAHKDLIGEEGHPGTGNYGLLDQIAALEWVKQNVGAFGGDPERVTIFGESAGAISICALMTSPLAAGLFDKALMQSGFCSFNIAHMSETRGEQAPASSQGASISGSLGCAEEGDELGCMRAASIEDLRAAAARQEFGPVIDEHVLPIAPAVALFQNRVHDVPLLIGANADEGTVFVDRNSFQTAE